MCISPDRSCAEIALSTAPVYISDEFDHEKLEGLSESDIFSVYCENGVICCNSPSVTFSDFYDDGMVSYKLME